MGTCPLLLQISGPNLRPVLKAQVCIQSFQVMCTVCMCVGLRLKARKCIHMLVCMYMLKGIHLKVAKCAQLWAPGPGV